MDEQPPRCVIVMGVSGSGKTTIARRIADELGWEFAEGDDFHSEANKAKMAAGTPLTDEDRSPWLRAIAQWVRERSAAGKATVVSCSALRRAYRDVLSAAGPRVEFCHVAVAPSELASRMQERQGHYMPAALLQSQLDTLEPLADDEAGVTVAAEGSPDEVFVRALEQLGLSAENREAHAGRR